MTAFGSPAPISSPAAIAAAAQAERARTRESFRQRASKPTAVRRAEDELDLDVTSVETVDAVRDLADNSQEDAHQDHREHPAYGPPARKPDTHPTIDVEG